MRPGRARVGRFERLVMNWVARTATIEAVTAVTPSFLQVDLAGEALRGVAWEPGQKIQVLLGGLRLARTYTPISWDGESGKTRLLIWMHGAGPGSDWAAGLTIGDQCQLFGPRPSLSLGKRTGPIVLFGDETSLALACAIARTRNDRPLQLLIESAHPKEVQDALGMSDVVAEHVAEILPGDAHLASLQEHLISSLDQTTSYLLTGRAAAIQTMQRTLREWGADPRQIGAKAYWAAGKTGLD